MCMNVAVFNKSYIWGIGSNSIIAHGWVLYFHICVVTFLISSCVIFITVVFFDRINVSKSNKKL